jgi:hypothetical protein
MANYYFVGTTLPELHFDQKPELGFRELNILLKDNLTQADYAKTRTIRNLYDILNLRAYWKGEPFDLMGNLNSTEMEEALVTRSDLPPYVFEFLDKYETDEDRLRHYPELLSLFFRKEISESKGFLKDYLQMERELRLVLLAFRAKKLGKDLYKELQYEDPEEDLIAQILAQKDAPQYEPPEKYAEIKNLLNENQDSPLNLQKALLEYRFQKIEELLGLDMFSIDRILGYLIELMMVEKWQHLDQQKGHEIIESMFKDKS